jgi:hypothetical protein
MRRFGLRRSLAFPGRKRGVNFDAGLHSSFDAGAIERTRDFHCDAGKAAVKPGDFGCDANTFRSFRGMAEWLGAPHLRNALTGLLLLALPMISTAGMVLFHASTALVLASVFFMTLIYLAIYRRVALLRRIPVTGMGEARGVGA